MVLEPEPDVILAALKPWMFGVLVGSLVIVVSGKKLLPGVIGLALAVSIPTVKVYSLLTAVV